MSEIRYPGEKQPGFESGENFHDRQFWPAGDFSGCIECPGRALVRYRSRSGRNDLCRWELPAESSVRPVHGCQWTENLQIERSIQLLSCRIKPNWDRLKDQRWRGDFPG